MSTKEKCRFEDMRSAYVTQIYNLSSWNLKIPSELLIITMPNICYIGSSLTEFHVMAVSNVTRDLGSYMYMYSLEYCVLNTCSTYHSSKRHTFILHRLFSI